MANTTLNTRILICNDTEVNWGQSSKVLLKGEMGIMFPTDTSKEAIVKVGDGVNTFDNLKAINVRNSDLIEITNKIGDLSTLKTKEKTSIVKAINEIVADIKSAGAIKIETNDNPDGYAKSYVIKQGQTDEGEDKVIGTINIPKDMVVKSGSVVVYEQEPFPDGVTEVGTYIELVIANATSDKLYINVGKLVDIYKVKANDTQIQLAIDPVTREISATIVDGSVDADALAKDAVTTEKIKDEAITKEKLNSDLQDTIDRAGKSVTDVKVNGVVVTKDTTGVVDIKEVTTDILKNGENTLVLDGGNADVAGA